MARKRVYYNCSSCGGKIVGAQFHAFGLCAKCNGGKIATTVKEYKCKECGAVIHWHSKNKYNDHCRKCATGHSSPVSRICGKCKEWDKLGDSGYGTCRSEEFYEKRLHASLHTHYSTKACGYFTKL